MMFMRFSRHGCILFVQLNQWVIRFCVEVIRTTKPVNPFKSKVYKESFYRIVSTRSTHPNFDPGFVMCMIFYIYVLFIIHPAFEAVLKYLRHVETIL